MLSVFVPLGNCLERRDVTATAPLPENGIWFDLVSPTITEDKLLERHLGIAVPTREEMQEIEVTSRLYVENGARYMTATMMCQSETDTPRTTAVTFILSGHRLVTVRYDDPKPFTIVGSKLCRASPLTVTGETVLIEICMPVPSASQKSSLVTSKTARSSARIDITMPPATTVATGLPCESRWEQSRRASLGKSEARPGRNLPTAGIARGKTRGPSPSSGETFAGSWPGISSPEARTKPRERGSSNPCRRLSVVSSWRKLVGSSDVRRPSRCHEPGIKGQSFHHLLWPKLEDCIIEDRGGFGPRGEH